MVTCVLSCPLAVLAVAAVATGEAPRRWSAEQANAWHARQPWLVGCNYVPSNAVNTTEMWQAETFDAALIDRELALAQGLGFNSTRVFVQYLVWQRDPEGTLKRLDQFVGIAAKRGLSTMPVLFDDCAFANKQPYLGKQDDPVPGVHNSGWTPSPGHERVADEKAWPDLERYVADIVGHFARDERIVVWDLYNEPGNSGMGGKSLPLVRACFAWARKAKPTQPLTIGVWNGGLRDYNAAQVELSDVASFHSYGNLDAVKGLVAGLKAHGRPLLCTEWLARSMGSLPKSHLPFFQHEKIACYNWGLVNGKTQTHLPWGSKKGDPDPPVWHHDLFRRDGTPYDPQETAFLRAFLRPATP
ncbi:MAG TPA: cellulase family glycosylhydrolase [Planctomycetota bacterium]|nr:cellulase family glycosylhydrolase [Planctomycetota bacterium]HRR81582.1 cellulase family glycosylhydrolase [Planctomycetota bacterium]HRT94865.1 cellulase family glycosylhydrolase [Planctomycetota bacterium]